jgi:hypothetical protein
MHHSARMAHMDIKPNNMLCTPQPHGALRCVLCDFGNAVDADAPARGCSGTEGYMAPEVALWDNKDAPFYVPRHADAFSMAATVLHLLHPDIQCRDGHEQAHLARTLTDAAGDDEAELARLISPSLRPKQRYALYAQWVERWRAASEEE